MILSGDRPILLEEVASEERNGSEAFEWIVTNASDASVWSMVTIAVQLRCSCASEIRLTIFANMA